MRLILLLLVLAAIVIAPLQTTDWGGDEPVVATAAIVLVVGGIYLLERRRSRRGGVGVGSAADDEREFLSQIVIVGFLVRVGLALVIHLLGWYREIAPDEGTFRGNAWALLAWLKGDSTLWLYSRHARSVQVGYFYLLAGSYWVLGFGRFFPVLLNCAIGAATAYPVYSITRGLSNRRAARLASMLVTFFPSLVLWSTLVIRDSIVVFVILSIVALVLSLRISFRPWQVLLLLLAFTGLGLLRQYMFLIVAACAGVAFVVGRAGKNARSLLVGAVAMFALFALMKGAGLGLDELERASLKNLALQRQFNAVTRDSEGSFRPEVDISRPEAALTYLPVGLFYFLASPFPWQLLSLHQAFALPEMLIWYAVFPFVLGGLGRMVKTRFRDLAMLLLVILSITLLYALVEGNVGIIFRHRAQVIAPCMVLAGIGLEAFLVRRAATRAARTAPAGAPG